MGLVAGLTAASAQTMENKQKIRECVEAARQAGLYPGRCVGVLADPCINAVSEGRGTGSAAQCASHEREVWAGRLDKTLASIALADTGLSADVEKAQKTWTPSLELCKVFEKLDPQAEAGAAEYCRLQATATRALLLEGLELGVSERRVAGVQSH
jgi:hypothetical protein